MSSSRRPEHVVDPGRTTDALDDETARLKLALEAAELEVEQLRRAVAGRTIIGQAQGILMERLGLDASQAFAYLTRASSHGNRKLLRVATEVVETRELPLGPSD